jgi:short-subunit dehydrogenase
MKLAGKRILITGGGHGLGLALVREFARAGADVVVTDRDAARIDAVIAELHAAGYVMDVTDSSQVLDVRKRLQAERGPIDLLINNAGTVFGGDFLSVPLERHLTTVSVNLSGLLAVTHAFLPDLIARPEARVVNIASAAAVLALPLATSYAASKWGVLGFSDSLREELRRSGHRHIGVTTICPSFVATGLFDGATPARMTSMLTPESVARAVRRAIERETDFVMLPRSAAMLYAVTRMLPRSLHARVCRWLGVSDSMAGWRGHRRGGE